MRFQCCVCKEFLEEREIDDGNDSISHTLHEECAKKWEEECEKKMAVLVQKERG